MQEPDKKQEVSDSLEPVWWSPQSTGRVEVLRRWTGAKYQHRQIVQFPILICHPPRWTLLSLSHPFLFPCLTFTINHQQKQRPVPRAHILDSCPLMWSWDTAVGLNPSCIRSFCSKSPHPFPLLSPVSFYMQRPASLGNEAPALKTSFQSNYNALLFRERGAWSCPAESLETASPKTTFLPRIYWQNLLMPAARIGTYTALTSSLSQLII